MPNRDERSNRSRQPAHYSETSESEEDAANASEDPSRDDAVRDKYRHDAYDRRREPKQNPPRHSVGANRNDRATDRTVNHPSYHPTIPLPHRSANPPSLTSQVDESLTPTSDDPLIGFSVPAKVLLDKNVVTGNFLEQSAIYLRHNPRLVRDENVSQWRHRARLALLAGDAETARKLIQQANLIELSQKYQPDGVDKFLKLDTAFQTFIKGSYTTFLLYLNQAEDKGLLKGRRRDMLMPWARFMYWAFEEDILETLSLPPDSVSADWAASASAEIKPLQPTTKSAKQFKYSDDAQNVPGPVANRGSPESSHDRQPYRVSTGAQIASRSVPNRRTLEPSQEPQGYRTTQRPRTSGTSISSPGYPPQRKGREDSLATSQDMKTHSFDTGERRGRISRDRDEFGPSKESSTVVNSARRPPQNDPYSLRTVRDERSKREHRPGYRSAYDDDDDEDEQPHRTGRKQDNGGRRDQYSDDGNDDDDTDEHFEDAQSKLSDDTMVAYELKRGTVPAQSEPRRMPKAQAQDETRRPDRPGQQQGPTPHDQRPGLSATRTRPDTVQPANPITRLSRPLIGLVGQKTFRECFDYFEDNPKIVKEDLDQFQSVVIDLLRQGRIEAAERVTERWIMLKEARSSSLGAREWMKRLPAVPARQETLRQQRDTVVKALEKRADTPPSSASSTVTSDRQQSTTTTQRAAAQRPATQNTGMQQPEVVNKPAKRR